MAKRLLYSDDEVLRYIHSFISDDETEMIDALDEEDVALKQYLAGRRRPEDSLPFDGASNLDIGGMVTMSHVDSIHARMMFAAEKSRPLVTFTGDDKEAVAQANAYMNHVFTNEVDLLSLLDEWVLESLIGGVRRAKATWHVERECVSETWNVQLPEDVEEEESLTDEHIAVLLIAKLSSLFGQKFEVTSRKDGQWKLAFKREGKEYDANLSWEIVGDKVKATIKYIKVVFRGVRVEVINPEDFHKSPGPIQSCRIITHRVWLTWEEIVQRVQAGIYTGIDISPESPHKAYAKRREDAYYTSQSQSERIRNEAAGQSPQSTLDKEYEFQECYIRQDWYGDGYLEDRVVTVFVDAKTVVRNKSRTAEGMEHRPFSEIIIGKIPGKPNAGFGIPKMIRDATNEESAVHNLTMDSAFLSAIAPLFYNGTTTLKPEQRKLKVGRINQIPDSGSGRLSDAFYKPDFRADLQPLFALYQRLQAMTQAVDGVGETMLMQRPSPRTASQSAMVQNELNIRFQRIFGRGMGSKAASQMTGLAGLVEIIVSMYRVHGDPVEVIDKTGKWAKTSFPRAAKFAVQLNVDVNKLNQEQEAKNAQMVVSTVSNPLMIQLKLVSPHNIYNAYRDLYLAMGVRNPEDYISKPDPRMASPMDPGRESVLLMRGVAVMPHPGDDDQLHYVEHRKFEAQVREAEAEGTVYPDPGFYAASEQHTTAHQRQAMAKQQAPAIASQMAAQGSAPPPGRPTGVPVGDGAMPGQGEGAPAGDMAGVG